MTAINPDAIVKVGDFEIACRSLVDDAGEHFLQIRGVDCDLEGEQPGVYYPRQRRSQAEEIAQMVADGAEHVARQRFGDDEVDRCFRASGEDPVAGRHELPREGMDDEALRQGHALAREEHSDRFAAVECSDHPIGTAGFVELARARDEAYDVVGRWAAALRARGYVLRFDDSVPVETTARRERFADDEATR